LKNIFGEVDELETILKGHPQNFDENFEDDP